MVAAHPVPGAELVDGRARLAARAGSPLATGVETATAGRRDQAGHFARNAAGGAVCAWQAGQQLRRVGMGRRGKEALDRRGLDVLAGRYDADAAADFIAR